jgi:HSP20 family molecular chaperone IbpA
MASLRDIGESIGSAVLDGIGRASAKVQERKPLPVDLLESDEAYLAVFDAPGVTAGDVSVRFEEGVLHVRVDRFREFYDDYEMRLPGRGMALGGKVKLPPEAHVDPENAEATVTNNGTLRVRIPKLEVTDEEEDSPIEIDTDDDESADAADTAEDEPDADEDEE